MRKNDNDLFFLCSLIEFMGRTCKLKRIDVVSKLGEETIKRIYQNAGILHCEPIAKTADVYIDMFNIEDGDFDNVKSCKYAVPDYWTIGEVYSRLIEDVNANDVAQGVFDVYSSFISDSISNYNSDFFYQNRDYIFECYEAKSILLY